MLKKGFNKNCYERHRAPLAFSLVGGPWIFDTLLNIAQLVSLCQMELAWRVQIQLEAVMFAFEQNPLSRYKGILVKDGILWIPNRLRVVLTNRSSEIQLDTKARTETVAVESLWLYYPAECLRCFLNKSSERKKKDETDCISTTYK